MDSSRRPRLTLPRLFAVSALGFMAACPDEGGDDGTLGPVCAMEDEEPGCGSVEGCLWDPDHEQCIVDCASIDERTACLAEDACYWNVGCHYGAI